MAEDEAHLGSGLYQIEGDLADSRVSRRLDLELSFSGFVVPVPVGFSKTGTGKSHV